MGHSLGGIVGGLVMVNMVEKIKSLITICTPWHGTESVKFYNKYIRKLNILFNMNNIRHHMAPSSHLLKYLAKRINGIKDKVKVFHIGATYDIISWLKNKNKKTQRPKKSTTLGSNKNKESTKTRNRTKKSKIGKSKQRNKNKSDEKRIREKARRKEAEGKRETRKKEKRTREI